MTELLQVMRDYAKAADFWSLFILEEDHSELGFRKGVQRPITSSTDTGAQITVFHKGGIGYAATQDLSSQGIKAAFDHALAWAETFAHHSLLKDTAVNFSAHSDRYSSPCRTRLSQVPLEEKLEILRLAERELRSHSAIIDTESTLWSIDSKSQLYNSNGAEIYQEIFRVIPCLTATASLHDVTQTRTLGGIRALCHQGDFETLSALDLVKHAGGVAKEAVDLVHADKCPNDVMDALIAPDQMILQIHESIGHPIELDRILGDERNYAGTSFVSLDMFGTYQYGSNLLNVTFDPTIPSEFASYGYDDEGTKAEKQFVIKDGILMKPLGAAVAQSRARMEGVACARASSWNRAPIDRMANLNLEPGTSSFSEMISTIEKGIYLKTNSSWSIDDSRNKFQFGCEFGQLIENGKLTRIVRNPNYRGISSSFWRKLKMVGDKSTQEILGSPYCGKGEPNQCIRVGHASPVCLFSDIDVFGGE